MEFCPAFNSPKDGFPLVIDIVKTIGHKNTSQHNEYPQLLYFIIPFHKI